ncbi:MAG: SWIM zinc finger family protein [Bifidobacteriaceae bacterium]|jgi:hypothetical protein|nr:SWIM zinc finger family protein [Bifidobacteriaceae bacterium]
MWFEVASVEALAPDQASLKAGRGLASASRWPELGHEDFVIWGECQGSGANPYQTAVDTRDMGYRCSCPSRKFPCKHALALMLIAAGQPEAVPQGATPEWVGQWLARRRSRKGANATTPPMPSGPSQPPTPERAPGTPPPPMPSGPSQPPTPDQPAPGTPPNGQPGTPPPMPSGSSQPPTADQPAPGTPPHGRSGVPQSPAGPGSPSSGPRAASGGDARAGAADAKSAAKRAAAQAVIAEGLEELDDWVADQLRLGLTRLMAEAPERCRRIAARLVDHKATALASRLDELPARLLALPAPERAHQLVRELGTVVLLVRAWRLDPDAPHIARAVGAAETRASVLANPDCLRVMSVWEVLGSRVFTRRDRLVSHATWLLNLGEGPPWALLQDYYPVSAGTHPGTMPAGRQVAAELVYYPGGVPTRAVVAVQEPISERLPWPVTGPPLAAPEAANPSRLLTAPAQSVIAADPVSGPASATGQAAQAPGGGDPLADCLALWDAEPWELETPVLLGPGWPRGRAIGEGGPAPASPGRAQPKPGGAGPAGSSFARVVEGGPSGQLWWDGGQVALPLARALPSPLVGSPLNAFGVWDGARLDLLAAQSPFGPVRP